METEKLVLSFFYGCCFFAVYQKLNKELKLKKEQEEEYRKAKILHFYDYYRKHRNLTKEQCQECVDNYYKTYKHPYKKYFCEKKED